MDLPSELTHEVGFGKLKLPIGLWAVAIVGGLWLSQRSGLLHLFSGGTASTDAASASTTDATTSADLSSIPTLGAGGAVNITPGGSFDSGTSTTLADNEAWRKAATQYLTNQNFNALAAANAIAKYLDGDPLTTVEQGMIEQALKYLGPTPEPVIPSTGPSPTPTPTPTPNPTPTPTVKPVQQSTPAVRISNPKFGIPGEKFVAFANTQDAKGTWWLTNKGGVWAAGTAPFYGSPDGQASSNANRTWAKIQTRWPDKGYVTIDSTGKSLTFG